MSAAKYIIHSYPGNVASLKAFIAAEFAGVAGDMGYNTAFAMGTENYSEAYLKNFNPTGQVPSLQTPDGNLFESDAIAAYIVNLNDEGKKLLGATAFEAAQVRQWIEFYTNQVAPVIRPWIMAYMPWGSGFDADVVAGLKKTALEGPEGKPACKHALQVWENALAGKEWICGGANPTLADVTIFVNSIYGWKTVLCEANLAKFPNIHAWAKRCIAHPKFAAAQGKNHGDATYVLAKDEPEPPKKE